MADEWYNLELGNEAEVATVEFLTGEAKKNLGKNFDEDIFTKLLIKKFPFLDV